MSPSRTRRPMTRPETADLTSTLMSGSTTPTSRTLTWRSSDCTLPRRNGDSSTSGLDLVVARATTRVPPTSTTAAPAITHLFVRIWPFFLHDRGPGRFFSVRIGAAHRLPNLSTQGGGERLQGRWQEAKKRDRRDKQRRYYGELDFKVIAPGGRIESRRIPYVFALWGVLPSEASPPGPLSTS